MRISDWSSDVCSSDLHRRDRMFGIAERLFERGEFGFHRAARERRQPVRQPLGRGVRPVRGRERIVDVEIADSGKAINDFGVVLLFARSEEHTSELQSLMLISYAVFCLKKKNIHKHLTLQQVSKI